MNRVTHYHGEAEVSSCLQTTQISLTLGVQMHIRASHITSKAVLSKTVLHKQLQSVFLKPSFCPPIF